MKQPNSSKSGGLSRILIGLQVLASVVLALVAVLLLNHWSGRPGVRFRKDMTAKEVNSLDASTQNVLENLPVEVTVDVFFRAANPPMTELVGQVQSRTSRLLERMKAIAPDRLVIRNNDQQDLEVMKERMTKLRLRGMENCVVLQSDDKVEVVRLLGGLASFDMGNPNPKAYRPPGLRSFNGEINILKAMLSVTRGSRPKLLFTEGHGELDPYADGPGQLGALESVLRGDGFVIDTWNPSEETGIPEDTQVIAIVGPSDDLGESTQSKIRQFVDGGGRLLIAPSADAEELKSSRLADWAKSFGIEVTRGTVLEPFLDPLTGDLLMGPRSNTFEVLALNMKRHPIMEPFLDFNRTFKVSRMHGVRVVSQPETGTGMSMPLFSSRSKRSWLDTVPRDHIHNPEVERIRGYDLAVASEYTNLKDESTEFASERSSSRVVILGSADPLNSAWISSTGGQSASRDMALNIFNWLASREWRVNISPKDPDLRLLRTEKVPALTRVVLWIVPGFFLLLGLVVAFFRSRGGPQRA
ncbi:MAG: GldG family protein [bacterium]|nr:GldG family protein [bacterium]